MAAKKGAVLLRVQHHMSAIPSEQPSLPRTLVPVSAIEGQIKESTFTLADGTVLKVQPVVVSIEKVLGDVDSDGFPKYIAKFGLALVKDCSHYSADSQPPDSP